MKKTAYILLLIGIQFLLNVQISYAQNTSNTLPFEKIDLVTDRDLYLSGESIWFRATVSLDNNQKELSKIIYIELFNADQKSIVRKKFRIEQGQAQGVLDIPSEFLSDTYFLRAYTHYTRNFPVESHFISTVQIINHKIGLSTISYKNVNEPIIYQNNTNSATGSSTTNISITLSKKQLGESTKAFLCANGITQQEIVFLNNGWGTLNFHSIDSLDYSLLFTNAKIDSLAKDLVLTPTNIYSIEGVASNNGQQVISIFQSNSLNTSSTKLYSLELTNNKLQVLSSSEFLLSDRLTQIILPNSEILNPGIYYYILKDENKNIVKIKAFIFKNESSFASNNNHKTISFNKRKRVNFSLNDIDTKDFTNIGIQVVLKGTILRASSKIELYLNNPQLLLSYLKSQFNPEELSIQEMDVFLNILNSKLNSNEFKSLFHKPIAKELKWLPEVRDIGLSGIVVDKLSQKPIENVPVYLSIFKDSPQIHIYESRSDGRFFFSLNNFESEQDVFLCPLFEKVDEIELKVNSDFLPIFPELKAIPLTIDSSHTKLLEQMVVASQTAKVFNLIPKNQDYSISHLPYSFENPQISIILDDYIETPTLEMVFKELVPSVRIKKRKDNFSLSVFDSERELFYNDPLILVDEVPIFNVNELMKISPNVIEKIEVHKSPFILGDHTINGIIMIRTITDNFGGMIMPKSSTFFEYQTLSPSYKFKAKTYNTVDELSSRAGDFRTLLHWEPLVQNNSNSQLKFYTSDQTGEYEAYIFGQNKNGQSFHFKLLNLNVTN